MLTWNFKNEYLKKIFFESFLNFPIEELNVGKLTVGKIYGGLLILENWKATRFGQIEPSASMVRLIWNLFIYFFFWLSVMNWTLSFRAFD